MQMVPTATPTSAQFRLLHSEVDEMSLRRRKVSAALAEQQYGRRVSAQGPQLLCVLPDVRGICCMTCVSGVGGAHALLQSCLCAIRASSAVRGPPLRDVLRCAACSRRRVERAWLPTSCLLDAVVSAGVIPSYQPTEHGSRGSDDPLDACLALRRRGEARNLDFRRSLD